MSVRSANDGTSIDLSAAGHDLTRKAEAARERGLLGSGEGTTLLCPCGYKGAPGAVIRYSEWDEVEYDGDLCICPKCGDA